MLVRFGEIGSPRESHLICASESALVRFADRCRGDMNEIVTVIELTRRLKMLPARRQMVAIVGAPASGKSTLAKKLCAELCETAHPNRAVVVPMDGFHYDDAVLEARGHRPRKGAPHTFDVDGLRHLLLRLRQNQEAEVAYPLFDRSLELSRAGAAIVERDVEVILVEGNYLLLDAPPWCSLKGIFDVTILLDVSEPELRRRLGERWDSYGMAEVDILTKLDENDLPNGRIVRTGSVDADLIVREG